MVSDYGRVGRLIVSQPFGDSTFMIVAQSGQPEVRAQKPDWRMTIVLVGSGTWQGSDPVIEPGKMIPVSISDPNIEWLDDETA